MFSRRHILRTAGALAALGLLPAAGRAADPAPASTESIAAALAATDLVYLSPLKADGAESRCQAEVWFVADGTDIFVVTATGAWRARAIRGGQPHARIWIGNLGVWTRTEGRYRTLAQVDAVGTFVEDEIEQARVLDLFGSKYPFSWLRWGPRFRNGLADGSRVMLRYRPALA
jgi:hypothetical protein